MIFKRGRYSGFLRPISYVIDLLIINILAYRFFEDNSFFPIDNNTCHCGLVLNASIHFLINVLLLVWIVPNET